VVVVGKLFLAGTFAAWAGAMWVGWREARLSIAPPPAPARTDLAADTELTQPPAIAPVLPEAPAEALQPATPPRPRVEVDEPETAVEAHDEATTADISGEVVDRDGRLLKAAILTARCSGRVYERQMYGSHFSLTVAPGSCTVFASDQLGRSQSSNFSVAAGETVNITLAPRGLDEDEERN
jgi:hypothetical protein